MKCTVSQILLRSLLLTLWFARPSNAQLITPAPDGTGTIASPQGNRIDITGGQLSSDGNNLFHSFTQLGLDPHQIANFLSHPSIQNILGRVTGGEVSTIDGVLQVTGGNSNLFLMNPAGIVFGSGAQLNVPASFTAVTANEIRFSNGKTFSSNTSFSNGNNYSELNGNPNLFSFTSVQPGAIVNAADLAVSSGQTLALLGGTVLSSGHLSAPDGQIVVAAVPGQSTVRLSQIGSPLSLEFTPIGAEPASGDPLSEAMSLPQLLTGGTLASATGTQVNADGTVTLIGSGSAIASGDLVAKAVRSRHALLSATRDLTLVESQLYTTGNLELLADRSVVVRDSVAHPFVARSGGDLTIRGDQGIDILALNHLEQTPFESGGRLSLVSDGVVSGDAHFRSGNGFSIRDRSNNPGTFLSYYDPIVIADGDVILGNYEGTSLKIEASGKIEIGDVNITGADTSLCPECSDPDADFLSTNLALILRAGSDYTAIAPETYQSFGSPTPEPEVFPPTSSTIKVGHISGSAPNLHVILQGQAGVTTKNITTQGGNVVAQSTQGNVTASVIDTQSPAEGGAIAITAKAIQIGELAYGSAGSQTNSGNLTLTASGEIALSSSFLTAPSGLPTLTARGAETILNGGAVTIEGGISTSGGLLDIVATGALNVNGSLDTSGAAVTLRGDQVTVSGSVDTSSGSLKVESAGLLTLMGTFRTQSGDLWLKGNTIDTASALLSTEGEVSGGAIKLEGLGDIATGILSFGITDVFTRSLGAKGQALEINTSGIVNINGSINNNGADIRIGNASANNQTIPNRVILNANEINTEGGNFYVRSIGDLKVSNAIATQGGTIDLQANTISSNDLNSSSVNRGFGNAGGAITLTSVGDLYSDRITTSTDNRSFSGGAISLTSQTGAIAAGDLIAFGGSGGDISVKAITSITLGKLDTSGRFANAGNVFIDPQYDIEVASIDARGARAGGNVWISTERFFRATETLNTGASIATDGSFSSGSIEIRHGGGALGIPFTVSEPHPVNGTAGYLSAGTDNQILQGSFSNSYIQGMPPNDIRLITTPAPPQPLPPVPPVPAPIPTQPLLPNISNSNNNDPKIALKPVETRSYFNETNVNVENIDINFTNEFRDYLGVGEDTANVTVEQAQAIAATIEQETGTRPAFIYVNFVPSIAKLEQQSLDQQSASLRQPSQQEDVLELILITAKGNPVRKVVYNATRESMLTETRAFLAGVTDRTSDEYFKPAQALYKSLISPLEADLKANQINTLVFLMESKLRSLPLAALHDGQRFLIETYSVGLMPSLSLTDTRYTNIKNSKLLAMGASTFEDLNALPAVPVELSLITKNWQGSRSLLNETFTVDNFIAQRRQQPYGILHLATHSEFKPGAPENSYIQFWNRPLKLNQIRELELNNPPVELLVLSACKTAIGDEQAELGFAGLAAQSGVKTALASLWYVSDEGTLALMSEFYDRLSDRTVKIKAEALRQSQIAMATSKIAIVEGQLVKNRLHPSPLSEQSPMQAISPDLALPESDLSHPYYWAAFTLVGNPW
ncbi:CHAT domain-containing protein [Myxacorys almedinensis]|uniref:CHAT domain-containing protein n=1 Tax=Myxacorys almedinensis A TaxID=2690445 RepID=A0A8J8CHY3_9CYAN|nr:CHAT domain-containing protein [Myxacorys almedinensis]NDJ15921.1 CHAT domain-containing protein [Myxacorys almedinensis A]